VNKCNLILAACVGIFAGAAMANDSMAMSQQACEALPGNSFLAAVERGDCDISIQTAAGPAEEANSTGEEGGGDNDCTYNCAKRDGRNGGDRGGDRGGNRGGDGGGNPGGGGRAGGKN